MTDKDKIITGGVKPNFKLPKNLLPMTTITGLIIVVVVGLIVLRPHKKTDKPAVVESLPLATVTKEQIEEAHNTLAVTGKVKSVDAINLVLVTSPNTEVTTYKFTNSTKIYHGVDHSEVKVTDIKVGTEVSISYNKANNEISEVWFE